MYAADEATRELKREAITVRGVGATECATRTFFLSSTTFPAWNFRGLNTPADLALDGVLSLAVLLGVTREFARAAFLVVVLAALLLCLAGVVMNVLLTVRTVVYNWMALRIIIFNKFSTYISEPLKLLLLRGLSSSYAQSCLPRYVS